MQNIQKFIPTLIEKRCSIQAFNLSCLYKDICLQNYKYNPKLDSCNRVIHEWEHYNKEESLNVDRIRQILNHDLKELLSETQNQYLGYIFAILPKKDCFFWVYLKMKKQLVFFGTMYIKSKWI